MMNFLKDCKITRVVTSQVAGTSDVSGSVIDMSGFTGVVFVASLGDVTTTSVLSLQGRESDAADGSSDSQITGSKTDDFTAGATSADNKVLVSECLRPSKRYVFPTLKRGTANAVVDGVLAIQYNGNGLPVTQSSSVIASALSTPEV